jgi:2-dehydro-3-deoxy-L-rhamnonate dehydrogenase (NAD+)
MPVTYDLSGKTAVVTGGAKGIGRAIVDRLVKSGAQVHIWDLNPIKLNSVASTKVDVTDRSQIANAIDGLVSRGSRIDVLVNDAGYLGKLKAFDEHEPSDWHQIIQVNLIGMMQVTQLVLPHMRRWGGGRIVNMASLAGKEGLAKLAAYSAASAGVISFTKALGREIADTNIRVNCVAPGPIDTDMIRDLGPEAVKGMINDSPLKRLGKAEEVAHMVVWLCSDASNFNTGAVFDMSGGRARYYGRSMSAFGTKRTIQLRSRLSAIGVTADIGRNWRRMDRSRMTRSGQWLCTAARALMPVSAPIKVLV